MLKSIIYLLLLISTFSIGQETPGEKQTKSILLLNGTAHLGNGKMIKRSAIGFENGTITMVENALTKTIDTTNFDTIIHIKDKHVYPGFIACNSTLGLMDIGAVRATRDYREVGTYNPNVRSLIAYNTDSKITPTIRTNGILIGQICPRGGVISGSSSIVQFDAWSWEDAVVKKDEGIHLNWPYYRPQKSSDKKSTDSYAKAVKSIEKYFNESIAYSKGSNNDEIDLRLEAMKGIFSGEKQLYIHANFIKEIADIINFKKEFNIPRLCIIGGYDSWLLAKRIKENNISIMLTRTHSLPKRDHDDIHLPFKLANMLEEEGVLFCIQNAGDMEQMITRNLPFMVGTAISYGLGYEKGVASVTLNAAKILGIEDQLGSLEKGKEATLFISSGDAFDMTTNKIELAFINGRKISLSNDQERNYLKYKKKHGIQ